MNTKILFKILIIFVISFSLTTPSQAVTGDGVYAWLLPGAENTDKTCAYLDDFYADSGTTWIEFKIDSEDLGDGTFQFRGRGSKSPFLTSPQPLLISPPPWRSIRWWSKMAPMEPSFTSLTAGHQQQMEMNTEWAVLGVMRSQGEDTYLTTRPRVIKRSATSPSASTTSCWWRRTQPQPTLVPGIGTSKKLLHLRSGTCSPGIRAHLSTLSMSPKLGYQDSDWAVTGVITATNPAPFSATISAISDEISGGIPADVDCGGIVFPYELGAGSNT
jgi:hypothetical protein